MKVKVVGKKVVDYVNKKGNHVEGTEYHCTYLDDKIEGFAVEKFYIPKSKLIFAEVGKTYEIYFNRFGGIETFMEN